VHNQNKAFSLIELSIVILIIGILVAGVTSSSRLLKQMKLKVKHNEQDILWDENQKILKELELENIKAIRKRSAVSIVIEGFTILKAFWFWASCCFYRRLV
jgi:prepilin-type N-terminal cleavage/methylation domain-containing protein